MVRFPKYAISRRVPGKVKGVKYLKLVSVVRAANIDAAIAGFKRTGRPEGEYIIVRLLKNGNVGSIKKSFRI